MNIDSLIWLLCGVALGWITKIPFLIKWYREFDKERKDRIKMGERIEELIKDGKL